MTRRKFLEFLGLGALALTGAGHALAFAPGHMQRAGRSYLEWAQLKYPGSWDPNPRGPERFLSELRRRTSIEPAPQRRIVEVGDAAVFEMPFLYISGRGTFPDLPDAAAWIRRYVEYGGFVLIDDASGFADSGFLRGVAALLARAFPDAPLKPLPPDHTVFQSFYLLPDAAGRKIVRPELLGLDREELTPVIVCQNDLAGAWDGDLLGAYTNTCVPGGERQREMSFRLGINLVMYAMTGNYKKDQVHLPFILKRRQRR